jgi:hypothetical protein
MSAPDAKTDLLWFLGIFALVGLIWFFTGGPNNPEANSGPFIQDPLTAAPSNNGNSSNNTYSNRNNTAPKPGEAVAPTYQQVRINTGNARYEFQPNREYITLEAGYNNSAPINISGWRLTNSKNPNFANAIVIPKANKLFVASSVAQPVDQIMLEPGARAYLITGGVPGASPFAIENSFQLNKCTGYIENLSDYRFAVSLSSNCPDPRDELGVDGLADECYDFVQSLGSCRTPKFELRVDGNGFRDSRENTVTGACRTYIEQHFNYNACVANHVNDADFYNRDWQVLLKRPLQLWQDNREVISLYDAQGRLVDRVTY